MGLWAQRFESIDAAVEDVFLNYLSRPNVRQPILTQYCDGKRGFMSAVAVTVGAAQNSASRVTAHSISYAITTEIPCISTLPKKFPAYRNRIPGFPLSVGSTGAAVIKIQEQLNAISNNYPLIPKLTPDGIFGEATQNAVRTFQSVFGLTQDGIVGPRTWIGSRIFT